MTVNVLGTKYTIKIVKISKCKLLRENNWIGSCNQITKEILIVDTNEEEYFGKMTDKEKELTTKEIMRHEIIHAFLNESGLQDSSMQYCNAWAKNEEMIDWIAIQFPKILDVFKKVGCI